MQEYKKQDPIQVPRIEESNGFYTTGEKGRICLKSRARIIKQRFYLVKTLGKQFLGGGVKEVLNHVYYLDRQLRLKKPKKTKSPVLIL